MLTFRGLHASTTGKFKIIIVAAVGTSNLDFLYLFKRWVDNIRMDLREIDRDGMDWIDLAQDRDQWRALVNTVMNLRFP
jgi:hypothetical protein